MTKKGQDFIGWRTLKNGLRTVSGKLKTIYYRSVEIKPYLQGKGLPVEILSKKKSTYFRRIFEDENTTQTS